jgi:Putative transposase
MSCARGSRRSSLAANVLPPVPVRQWVLSLPRRVRFLAARRPDLASRLLDVFTRAVFAWQRRSARRLGAAGPRTGGVTAIQRFGGALNLNLHFHTLIPDGVFVAKGDGPARYFPIPQPRDEDVAAILTRVVRRAAKVIVGFDEDLDSQADALAALQAAEVERRLRYPEPFEQARRGAFLDGFSLHAGIRIHANDGDGRERLCRYILRPPLALHRLSRSDDGTLLYRMKRPRHGSLWLSLTPEGLLGKLATLIPPPRVHGVRYHGVFAPHSRLRSRVVPEAHAPELATPELPDAAAGDRPQDRAAPELDAKAAPERPPLHTCRVPWADLLEKVFAIDVLACPECGGRLRLIAFIAEARVARRILDHLGLDSTVPPLATARGEPDRIEPAPDYDLADPICER